jgi:hypothetical protein
MRKIVKEQQIHTLSYEIVSPLQLTIYFQLLGSRSLISETDNHLWYIGSEIKNILLALITLTLPNGFIENFFSVVISAAS